jgi:hypothetical protein
MILRGLSSSYRFYDRKLPVDEIIFLLGRSQSTIYAILRMYDRYGEVSNPHASHTGQICVLDNIFKISWKLDLHLTE